MTDSQQPSHSGAESADASIADRLRNVVVDLRSELDISRHVFRDGPSYIVRDPITFGTHRFDPQDYKILRALEHERTLGEIFETLIQRGALERSEESEFYEFILDLHQRSLLTLPINSGDALYQRYERRKQAERSSKALGILFLRVPLINPDRFLSTTLPLFRWLFTTPAFIAWMTLTALALVVASSRLDDLSAPVLTSIQGQDLLMLWGALIGLKVVHEFGHAYACRSFGGHVPEMGAFFILFTPLAYVDASDSWKFSSTRQRAIVTLGGVYFESIVGIAALAVWSVSDAGPIQTLAYQIMLLSTITTLAFNMNPLLRYDAYYLVSDLVKIPNLRARCQEALTGTLKRLFFGIRASADGTPFHFEPGLLAFGMAQAVYRVVVMVTISAVVTMKFGIVGIVISVLIIGMAGFKAAKGICIYVLRSEETAPIRFRAVTTTLAAATIAIIGLTSVPLPWPLHAKGVVSYETVEALPAPMSGYVEQLRTEVGSFHTGGDVIATLTNPDAYTELQTARAEQATSRSRLVHASMRSPSDAERARIEQDRHDARIRKLESDVAGMAIAAPSDGRVLDVLVEHEGSHVKAGEPIALFGSGSSEAVFHVRAHELDGVSIAIGDEIVCRSHANPEVDLTGTVIHVGPAGSRDIDSSIRHAAPTGLVPTDQRTGLASAPYFEIRLRLPECDSTIPGTRIEASLPAHRRTTAAVIERHIIRFLNRVRQDRAS